MKNNILNFVDKIYCINLDIRNDRWLECLEEFKKIGIENIVERFPAIQHARGIIGCTKSHIECIKNAKYHGYKNILILEDDISFNQELFDEIIVNVFEQINNKKVLYDLLYLGANLCGNENYLIDKNLAKLVCAKTTHAIILNSNIFDFIISSYQNINWNDLNLFQPSNNNRMNIDVFYIRDIQSKGNVYGVYPSLAEQRISFSDLIGSVADYNLSNVYNKKINKNGIL